MGQSVLSHLGGRPGNHLRHSRYPTHIRGEATLLYLDFFGDSSQLPLQLLLSRLIAISSGLIKSARLDALIDKFVDGGVSTLQEQVVGLAPIDLYKLRVDNVSSSRPHIRFLLQHGHDQVRRLLRDVLV